MCGIAGSVEQLGATFDIGRALRANSHRGPDAQKVQAVELGNCRVQLGHARLAIIDPLARADQPMWSGSGRSLIVFNGEVYNYRELRADLISRGRVFRTTSDTEVLLEGYEADGVDFISKLVGMFAFCLVDMRLSKIFLVRDRLGVKPLYYRLGKGRLFFSSDLRGLVEGGAGPCEVDQDSLNHYLIYGYTSERNSILRGIKKQFPGSILTVNLDGWVTDESFYHSSIGDSDDFDADSSLSKSRLRTSLITAVERRLVSDVQVGAFLSGGYDSSLVVAISKRELGYHIPTFTVGFDNPAFDESVYAAAVADHLGVDHNIKICTPRDAQEIIQELPAVYDEPFGDSSAIPTILVSRFARQQVKVALGADGGDELFGGYRKYFNVIKLVELYKKYPFVSLLARDVFADFMGKFIPPSIIGADANPEVYRKALRILRERLTPAKASDVIERSLVSCKRLHTVGRRKERIGSPRLREDAASIYESLDYRAMRALDLRYYLPSNILVKVDRASMSCGLEAREPLLDIELLRLAHSIGADDLYGPLGGKLLLKEVCHSYIPESLMRRPKMGFGIPVRDWMRKELKFFFDNEFFSDDLLGEEFVLPRLRYVVKSYYAGENQYFNYLWYVFNFSRWKRAMM
jgi:asparagine synthase (glutamine-hydrolysing)